MEVTSNASLPNKKYRLESGRKIVDFESAVKQLGSERRAAKHTGIPRSTYHHLHDREKRFDMSEVTLQFFRTSDGVHFLHRLTLSIEFVISHICGSGIGAIQKVYELSQLDKIIATSDGSLCDRLQRLEDNIVEFGEIQFDHLSKQYFGQFLGESSLNHEQFLRRFCRPKRNHHGRFGRLLMESVVKSILSSMSSVNRPQMLFMLALFSVLGVFQGKATFRNMSRYSEYCERSFSRWYRRSFEYAHFNRELLRHELQEKAERIGAIDASFMKKSGKHTEGMGWFYHSCSEKPGL